MSAAEPGIAHTLERPDFPLRPIRIKIEDGMFVDLTADYALLARCAMRIECHESRRRVAQGLKLVHPVGDRWLVRLARPFGDIVPARPGGPPPRHQRNVTMQNGLVTRIAEGTENAFFLGAGVDQHGKRLVGMGGDDDIVESLLASIAIIELDTLWPTAHALHTRR